MTLVRSVAGKISRAVVRFASPGCKEWAEGLARETAFIGDDWAALRWALGSTRVLLDRRAASLTSLADVAERARRYAAAQRSGLPSNWIVIVYAFDYLLRLFGAGSRLEHTGCSLVVFGGILMGVIGLVRWQQRTEAPLSDETTTWALYYRSELELRRENLHSVFGVLYRFGWSLYWIGLVLAQKGGVRAHPMFTGLGVLVFALATPVLFRETFTLQLQIEEVDAVLGRETGGGVG
jgi:hypothetical protein